MRNVTLAGTGLIDFTWYELLWVLLALGSATFIVQVTLVLFGAITVWLWRDTRTPPLSMWLSALSLAVTALALTLLVGRGLGFSHEWVHRVLYANLIALGPQCGLALFHRWFVRWPRWALSFAVGSLLFAAASLAVGCLRMLA